MNKKSLLNLAMCSLLLGSMPMGLVGCKDYDGDIKDLNTTTGDLSSQISSLKTALDAANTAATNAANDAKAAADKADTATQEVALAKKAAEEAKAEAIAAAIAEVEKLQSQMSDMNAETAKELAALAGRIDGIEAGLNKIDLTKVDEMLGGLSTQIQEANKQISAINVQIAALENLKTEVPAMKTSIDAITKELSTVKAKAEANTTSINEIKGELATISSKISSEVTNAVNTIAGILAQRLTSVTLIPELYVGGVPSISFENGTYNKIEWKADDKVVSGGYYIESLDKDNKNIKDTVTNGAVEAKYRLNPATITAQDIDLDGIGYFTHIAEFRTRASEEKEVLTITGKSVGADGILTVQLSNPNPTKLREDLKYNEDYTVSLRVPVAKSHLFEGETKAEVYSEFARLREINFRPSLGLSYQAAYRGPEYVTNLFNGQEVSNIADLYASSSKNFVVKNLSYDKTYNLNDLFIGRMRVYNPYSEMDTIAYGDLAKYDLAIRYKVAGGSYTPGDASNKVDQQKYVKLSGEGNSILTPQTPSGVTANQAIIGKAPILLAELYDVNNGNVIDAEYFKVMFTAAETEDIKFTFNVNTFDIPGENDNFTADACGIQYSFTWEYMTKNLLEKLNGGKGMSQTEFKTLYNPWRNSTQIPNSNIPTAYLDSYYDYSQGGWLTSPDVPAMKIYANEDNLPALKPGDNALKFGNVITFESKVDGYPNIVITINWTPTLKVTKATLGETLASSWTNNTMTIRVKPMNIVNGKWDEKTAEYSSNILAGRVKPYVNGLTGCATYSIAYAPVEDQDAKLMESLHNYRGETFGEDGITRESQKTLEEVLYKLNSANADAKTLASKGGTIKLVWKSDINGLAKNLYTVGYTNLYVAPILQYKGGNVATLTSGSVPDTKTLAITFQDAYGNNVVKDPKTGPDYWEFYDIESVTYTLDGAKWGTSTDVTTATKLSDTPYGVTLDSTGTKITFNNNGSTVNTKSYIFVPFTVKHKWGELTGYALVTVNVTPN